MNNSITPDQSKIIQIMVDTQSLLLRKNADYGSSFRSSGTLSGEADPILKLLVRIDDKLERFRNLRAKQGYNEINDESISDTVRDLIGYFVLILLLMEENAQRTADREQAIEMHSDQG